MPTYENTRVAVRLHLSAQDGDMPVLDGIQDLLRKYLPTHLGDDKEDCPVVLGIYVVGQQGYECNLCGGDHVEKLHGEPWFTQDVGRDTAENELGRRLEQLNLSIYCRDTVNMAAEMTTLLTNWSVDSGMEVEIDFQHYDNKMDEIAAANGFVLVNDSEANGWWIYDAVDEQLFTSQRFFRDTEAEQLDV